jgi:CheY-like chemotaxis protein
MSKDKLAPFEVLLVEDNDDDADWTIKTLTEKADGCRVTRAENGQDVCQRSIPLPPTA